MRGSGPRAEQISNLFKLITRKLGLNLDKSNLSPTHFKRPPQIGDQLSLPLL